MTLSELNGLTPEAAASAFEKCCGASRWVKQMTLARPFSSEQELFRASEEAWSQCGPADWMEAFTHHPRIGDISTLASKFASTKDWAGNEQSGVNNASMEIIERLAKGNTDYEEKFGFIFIVCATGKTAAEMLELLEHRYPNDREKEMAIAAGEQAKITQIRLEKLLA